MDILLPNHVKKCIEVLENAGHEVFCVGGAVRDLIIGDKKPFDFDLAVSCPPSEVLPLFPRVIPTGIKHGTVTVIMDDVPIEVTTYRLDGDYRDTRHPDSVLFVGNIEDDLARRDFTVNAIAYNEKSGILDLFGGITDIKNKILKTVGDPCRRFSEDALRIMRLFRFASQLGFSIEEETKNGAINSARLLEAVSAERIATELLRMLSGEHLENTKDFFECGMLAFLGLKGCDIKKIANLENDIISRFSALCVLSKTDCSVLCKNLKLDNAFKSNAIAVCDMLRAGAPKSRAGIKQYLSAYGAENFECFIKALEISEDGTDSIKAEFLNILEAKEPYLVSHLAIGGNDLMALGFFGKEIGEKLEFLKNAVIEDPALNQKEKLIELITK